MTPSPRDSTTAGSLVAEHDGMDRPLAPVAVGSVDVGVADAARQHADRDLTRLRRVELEILDPEGFPDPVQDGGAHGEEC